MTTAAYKSRPEARKLCEDSAQQEIEKLDEFNQATIYMLLYALGMRIDTARKIRLQAGATD